MKSALSRLPIASSLLSLAACAVDVVGQHEPTYRFVNGNWFTGEGFSQADAYIIDDALHFSDDVMPAQHAIDLDGAYVVPPFCESHNHNLGDAAEGVQEVVNQYLQDGVFYVMLPGSFERYRNLIADEVNTPLSVDAAFANNGLTGSGGHPRALREFLKERYGLYPEFTKEELVNKGFFEADTLDELSEAWALVLAEKPDFVKVMLLYSEEYDERKDDPKFYGKRGLDPALMPALVSMAHDAQLRVAVHVETEADLMVASRAGADIIAHLVSHNSDERLSDEGIALAKETGVVIETTAAKARSYEERAPEKYAAIVDAQRYNLRRLHDAGVTLAIGSDNVRDTSRGEAEYLKELGVFDNETLLEMWTENCAHAVFPDRKVGRLADGYEASFLVLEDNPLEDFDATRRIKLRVKDGKILELQQTRSEVANEPAP